MEKYDKVSLDSTQVVNLAMVITGLNIQIAIHFIVRVGGGVCVRQKDPCAGTLTENGRGAYA